MIASFYFLILIGMDSPIKIPLYTTSYPFYVVRSLSFLIRYRMEWSELSFKLLRQDVYASSGRDMARHRQKNGYK
jgi:hypothetical protein